MEFIPCDNMNEVQLCLRIKNDERLIVKWDAQDSAVSIDRTNAMKGASHGEPVYRANVSRNANGGISLRIILDTTAVEMFANDGEVFCNLLYYTMNDGEKLSLATTDGSLIMRKLVIYRLHDMEFFAKERG
jgi:sucrose-6-phosphate hydrolase SacC (GH32 family)